MRQVLAVAVFAVCVVLCAGSVRSQDAADSAHGARVEKFDPARDPERDLKAAMVEAKRTGKRILLDVGGEWCIWCRRLDSLFLKMPDLADQLHQGFVVVKVNYSKENKNEKFLSGFPKIPGYPHLFVLDAGGMLLHSQDTGALESGKGHDPAKIVDFMNAWGKPYVKKVGKERR
jgi:thiol:disulfide interchange protein